MGSHDKDIKNGEDYKEWGFSKDDIAWCKIKMLGVVMQWQPRVEDITVFCIQSPRDYNI
jgi:hypothetical protein